jgi:hypothetical protein
VRRLLASALVVAVLVAASPTASSASAAPEVTAAELAHRFAAAASAATAGTRDPSAVAMDALRAGIGLPLVVVFDEGDRMLLGPDPMLERLVGLVASDFETAKQRIAALSSLFERVRAATPPARADVRAALARAYRGISAQPSILERIRRKIGELLDAFLMRLLSFRGGGTLAAWLLVGGLLVVAIWLLTRLKLVPERRVQDEGEDEGSVDWHGIAADALARGDQPEAVRAHYRALLAALAARGVLQNSPSLTAGECRRTVGSAMPTVYPDVAQATGIFERVAYGRRPLEPGDLEAMRRAEDRVAAA